MHPRGGIFFPITSSNLSGTLLHSETVKGNKISFSVSGVYKACSQYDFNVVIVNDRKFEENKISCTKFHLNIISVTFLNIDNAN